MKKGSNGQVLKSSSCLRARFDVVYNLDRWRLASSVLVVVEPTAYFWLARNLLSWKWVAAASEVATLIINFMLHNLNKSFLDLQFRVAFFVVSLHSPKFIEK